MTPQQLQRQRQYRLRTGNRLTKKYEKTKKGFLMRLYRNMKSRIDGVQRQKAHLYKDKFLLPREEFYQWALGEPKFHELFKIYEENNYDRKLAPSADRKNSSLGYSLDNIEFVTMSENSRRGSINQAVQRRAKKIS